MAAGGVKPIGHLFRGFRFPMKAKATAETPRKLR
jgi:hypothetical protein